METHQQTPKITVYVPTAEVTKFILVHREFPVAQWVEEKRIPDPSYIRSIVNDPASAQDKVNRLEIYFKTFEHQPD